MAFTDLQAQHALQAGLAGLLLLLVFPGLLVLAGLAPLRRYGLPLLLPLAFSLSLLINHHAVLLLTAIGQFHLIGLCLATSGLAVLVRWLLGQARDAASPAGQASAWTPSPPRPAWPLAVRVPAALAAALSMGWLLNDLARHIPAVFEGWDAVVSWNRWALDWASGSTPRYTYGYPQLLPTAWASTYLWVGSPRIEFLARGVMGLFPLGVALIGIDLYRRFRSPAALLAIALWCALVVKVYPDLRDSGYADIPVTFFIALSAYLVLLAHERQMPASLAWTLLACVAASAVHTKQAGWLLVVWAIGVAALSTQRSGAEANKGWRSFGLWVGLLLLWVLPWHVWLWLQFQSGAEVSNVSYVTAHIYGDETMPQRGWRALSTTLPAVFVTAGVPRVALLLAVGACLLALRNRWGRWLVLGLALPWTLLWALAFSYDTRNLMPAMPFYCLAVGLGLQQLLPRGMRQALATASGAVRPDPTEDRFAAVPLAGVVVALLALVFWLVPTVPASQLAAASEAMRRKAGSPEVNQRLIAMAAGGRFEGQVITTYQPMLNIAELRAYAYADYARPSPSREAMQALQRGAPICEVMRLLSIGKHARWMLLHRAVFAGSIDSSLHSGQLQLEFEADGLRLMRLACPST